MRKGLMAGIVLSAGTLFFVFSWLVWPTPYRYFSVSTGRTEKGVIRINRFSGSVARLDPYRGWVAVGEGPIQKPDSSKRNKESWWAQFSSKNRTKPGSKMREKPKRHEPQEIGDLSPPPEGYEWIDPTEENGSELASGTNDTTSGNSQNMEKPPLILPEGYRLPTSGEVGSPQASSTNDTKSEDRDPLAILAGAIALFIVVPPLILFVIRKFRT